MPILNWWIPKYKNVKRKIVRFKGGETVFELGSITSQILQVFVYITIY